MKKIMITFMAFLCMALSADAMSYEQARREAFFLTDKMAYELNLTQEQYDAAYEINLDYLMGVTTVDDVFGAYWRQRNLDISYILLDWQWEAFCAATYFYRPLYWSDGFWHFAIYARYPRRNYFYFSHPTVYATYRGGHSWRNNGGRSYYHGHSTNFKTVAANNGLRDKWDRGEFRGNRSSDNSSTRVTVNKDNDGRQSSGSGFGNSRTSGSFSGNRSSSTSASQSSSSGSSGVRSGSGASSSGSASSSGKSGTGGQVNASRLSSSSSKASGSSTLRNSSFGGTRKSGTLSGTTTVRSASAGGSSGASGTSSGTSAKSSSSSSSSSRSGGFSGSR